MKKKKKKKSAIPANKLENHLIMTKFASSDIRAIKRAAKEAGDYYMSRYVKRIVKEALGI